MGSWSPLVQYEPLNAGSRHMRRHHKRKAKSSEDHMLRWDLHCNKVITGALWWTLNVPACSPRASHDVMRW